MAKKREPYNPLLKSYPNSEKVNAVSLGAETLFTRLIADCDDNDCHDGDPRLLLARLYAKRWAAGQVREKDVAGWLSELEAENLVYPYKANGRRYIRIVNCRKDLRNDVALEIRFPQPPAGQGVPEGGPDAARLRPEAGTVSGHQPNPTQPNPTQPKPPTSTAAGGAAECQLVVDYWNEHRGKPRVTTLTAGRRAKLGARFAEPDFIRSWQVAINRIGQAPEGSFLNGGGDRGWRADFDWFIRNDTNYVRVLEGWGADSPKEPRSEPGRVRSRNGRYDKPSRILN